MTGPADAALVVELRSAALRALLDVVPLVIEAAPAEGVRTALPVPQEELLEEGPRVRAVDRGRLLARLPLPPGRKLLLGPDDVLLRGVLDALDHLGLDLHGAVLRLHLGDAALRAVAVEDLVDRPVALDPALGDRPRGRVEDHLRQVKERRLRKDLLPAK